MSKVITQRPPTTTHLDHHHSTHASLQSTAMMRDISNNSVSHHPSKPVSGVNGVALPTGTPHLTKHDPLKRTVLGRVNVNIAHNAAPTATSAPKHHQGRVTRSGLQKTIPQPAPTPDVFASDSGKAAAAATSLGKRQRADASAREQAISKRARAEASQQAARHLEEQDKWIAKWRKAFPSLVFHFDVGVDEGVSRGLRQRVLGTGAKVDQFFSQRVSHLVVKGVTSPQKKAPTRRREGQSDNPFLDYSTGGTDLVSKAEKLGIKVWTVKKLADMLNKLAPVDTEKHDSLSNLLADEKLNGTRERDFSAPRPDYYYFRPGSKYLLVEDATARHRPVMIKEYSKDLEWPIIHDQFLRLTTSNQLPPSVEHSKNLVRDLRERAWSLYVENTPFRGEEPPVPSLKRSNSLREMPVTPLPEELPYHDKASGNSVVITSNIASTSTANQTPNAFGGGGNLQLGANKDRAIMQMSKRVQVLKGNARLAASVSASAKRREHMEDRGGGSGSGSGSPERVSSRRRSTGTETPAPAATKEFLSQAQVVNMLRQLRAPTTQTKPSYDERLRNREHVDAGYKRKDQDTASGYCENCRVRYNDLSVHIASGKHRRFAHNAKNFADLDDMLQCLQRPPNPLMCVPARVCRPCWRAHDKDAPCGRCMDDEALFSSPASTPGSTRKRHYAFAEAYAMERDASGASREASPSAGGAGGAGEVLVAGAWSEA